MKKDILKSLPAKHCLGIALFLYLLPQCSSVRMFTVDDLNTVKIPESPNLVITFLSGDISVSFNESVRKVFGEGKTDELISNYLKRQVVSQLKKTSVFNNVTIDKPDDVIKFDKDTLTAGMQPRFTMNLPSAGTSLSFNGTKPEYVLFLEKTRLVKKMRINMENKVEQRELQFKSKAVYWDNIKGKIYATGNIDARQSTAWAEVPESSWKLLTESFADKLVNKSGFEKKTGLRF
jgi:hypothetical protein